MNIKDPFYIRRVNVLTDWMPIIKRMYFSYISNVASIDSDLARWNSLPLSEKNEIIDAIFAVKISPFYGCSSRYKAAVNPCLRRRANPISGISDCMDGLIADVEASCRQANSPDFCRKVFLPTVENSFSCSDSKRRSLDAFSNWLLMTSSSSQSGYKDFIQKRYLKSSSSKNSAWK